MRSHFGLQVIRPRNAIGFYHQFRLDSMILNDIALAPVDILRINVLTNDDVVIQGQSK